MSDTVFAKLRVLDHTRYLLGGYATQVLADLGAEVIKIEEPTQGDLCRLDQPSREGVSYYFSALGRNKKSLTLNMKAPAAREAYLQLLQKTDVVVENFRPGVMDRLGIGYEAARAVKPDIIHCAMTSYGQTDPRSRKALHDINLQALSGYLSLNGGRTSPIHLVDLSAGMAAVQSILAALLQRNHSGQGAFCDIHMFDCFVWWNSLLDARYQFDDSHISADSLEFPALAYNIYETSDGGRIAIGMLESKFWEEFLATQGLLELFPYKLCRRHEAQEAFSKLEAHFKSKTLEQWRDVLSNYDFCAAPVLDKEEAIRDILRANTGLMRHCSFPKTGETLQTRIPHLITSLPVSLEQTAPPPALGEHSVSILQGLGYTPEEIRHMTAPSTAPAMTAK